MLTPLHRLCRGQWTSQAAGFLAGIHCLRVNIWPTAACTTRSERRSHRGYRRLAPEGKRALAVQGGVRERGWYWYGLSTSGIPYMTERQWDEMMSIYRGPYCCT